MRANYEFTIKFTLYSVHSDFTGLSDYSPYSEFSGLTTHSEFSECFEHSIHRVY